MAEILDLGFWRKGVTAKPPFSLGGVHEDHKAYRRDLFVRDSIIYIYVHATNIYTYM